MNKFLITLVAGSILAPVAGAAPAKPTYAASVSIAPA